MTSLAPAAIRAPTGTTLSCKGWHQEAALRMLMNNLDPAVAERPEDLVVYGGTGKAARNWDCFEKIVETLRRLENDETLLVQSGKPVGVFRTHDEAPRVLIANAHLVPRWATWDEFRRLEALGLTMYGQMTAGLVDLHRHPGDPAGHLRDLRRVRPAAFRRHPGRAAGRDRRTGRHGRRPAARRHHERRRVARRGRGRVADPAPGGDRLLRPDDHRPRRGARLARGRARERRRPLGRPGGQHRHGRCPSWSAAALPWTCVTDQTSAHDLRVGYIPAGYSLDEAAELRERDPAGYEAAVLDSMVTHVEAMLALQRAGAVVVRLRQQPPGPGGRRRGMTRAFDIPGFVPEFIRPLFCRGAGPFRWVALSGDPADIAVTDDAVLETFPGNEPLARWIRQAREQGPVPGTARPDLLARVRRARRNGAPVQLAGEEGKGEGADRHRPGSPRYRFGRVTQPGDRRA